MKLRYTIIGTGVAVALLVGLIVFQHATASPVAIFERLVAKPMPASVQGIEHYDLQRADNTFEVLCFQVNEADLKALTSTRHFAPLEDDDLKRWDNQLKKMAPISREEYLADWASQIKDAVGLTVNLTTNWSVWLATEGNTTKHIFFDPKLSQAVFVAEVY